LRLVSGAAQHWLNMRPGTSFLGERVLIVGSGVVGRWAASLLSDSELLPDHRVVGAVDDSARRRDAQIGGFRVLGTTSDIVRLVRKYEIGVIVFAISECEEADRKRILDQCDRTPARVIFLPDIVDSIQSKFTGSAENELPVKPQGELQKALAQLDLLLQDQRVSEAREYINSVRAEQIEVEATQFAAD
jgi:FlaA1/EpsC-like NDP-sugar epimerase